MPVSTRLCWNCAFLVAGTCGYLTIVDCNVQFSLSVGMYQLLTQGTADIVLDSCTDYWDGTTLCSLTDLDRYISVHLCAFTDLDVYTVYLSIHLCTHTDLDRDTVSLSVYSH